MKFYRWTYWIMAIALSSAIKLPAQGVQAPDGTVSFESGLLLKDAYTTFRGVRVRQARYYFDLELPDNIGEPLKKVVIQQRSGGDEIKFKPEKTEVYLGNHSNKLERVQATATLNEDSEKITVQFAQPIPPGSSVTIGLKPRSNPDYGGAYLFGVTAYPTGNKARGMYLGAGRLDFDLNDNDPL